MLTTALDLIGLALVVAAAYLAVGLALALFVAGAGVLFASWNIEREKRRGAS